MIELLAEAARLGAELPVAVALEIAQSTAVRPYLYGLSPASRREPLSNLFRRWQGMSVDSFGVALLTASLAQEQRRRQEGIELVWTGPDSHIIPVRQTEQVLLDLIGGARKHLLVVSYAVYRIPAIRQALVDAAGRGVAIRIILDLMDSTEVEGYNPLLSIGQEVLACTEILYWPKDQRIPDAEGRQGILHVKCVVADAERMFISSANLTEQAFKLNMELGVMITGPRYPKDVDEHFSELIARGVLKRM